MKISDYLKKELCILELRSTEKESVILEMTDFVSRSGFVSDKESLTRDILEREKLGSTGIGNGVAIPHSPTESVEGFMIVFGRSHAGIDFNSLDGEKVNLVFLMATNPVELNLYLKLLAKLSKLLIEDSFRRELLSAVSAEEVIEIFRRFETV